MSRPGGETSQPAGSIATAAGMTTTYPDAPLVISLSVLYEDEPDGRVIAHIPQIVGPSAAATTVARPAPPCAACCAT